jgi:hypothetical protein
MLPEDYAQSFAPSAEINKDRTIGQRTELLSVCRLPIVSSECHVKGKSLDLLTKLFGSSWCGAGVPYMSLAISPPIHQIRMVVTSLNLICYSI